MCLYCGAWRPAADAQGADTGIRGSLRNLAVTDDTLVQSIGELRRELGEDGPRLIKTIPRRGY